MKLKIRLVCSAAAASIAMGSADAATIHLIDTGGVAGSVAAKDFQIAADYWGNMFTNNADINLGVGFNALPPHVIGSTGSTLTNYTVQNWENRVNATKSSSALDQSVVLPTRTGAAVDFITNGVDSSGGNDTSTEVYQTNKYSGYMLYLNTAVVKAIGGAVADPGALDGDVTFSSDFAFDFDPTNGIDGGKIDFLGVAIHEIGHALGFVSGVDFLDGYGAPHGPGYSLGYDLNDTSIYSALDMFRYSADLNNLAPGLNPVLDESVGAASYFSIDGGATALFGNTFSTGAYNGDGNQASHWKDSPTCDGALQLGIMDPTFCYGEMGEVKALDLAAYDAMGWNVKVDVLKHPGYSASTASIFSTFVPEPSSWALMMGGFGMVGGALRRRRKTAVSFG